MDYFLGLNPEWNNKDRLVLTINGKNYNFYYDEKIKLSSGDMILVKDLVKKLQDGEELDVEL